MDCLIVPLTLYLCRYSRNDFDNRWIKFVERLIRSWQLLTMEALQARANSGIDDYAPMTHSTISRFVHELLEHLFARIKASVYTKEHEPPSQPPSGGMPAPLMYRLQYESAYIVALCETTLISLHCNRDYTPTVHLVPQIWKFLYSIILCDNINIDQRMETAVLLMHHLSSVIVVVKDVHSSDVSHCD